MSHWRKSKIANGRLWVRQGRLGESEAFAVLDVEDIIFARSTRHLREESWESKAFTVMDVEDIILTCTTVKKAVTWVIRQAWQYYVLFSIISIITCYFQWCPLLMSRRTAKPVLIQTNSFGNNHQGKVLKSTLESHWQEWRIRSSLCPGCWRHHLCKKL